MAQIPPRFDLFFDHRLGGDRPSLYFEAPRKIVSCDQPESIGEALEEIEDARQAGFWVAGYLSYEAGYALEPKLHPLMPEGRQVPLLSFGIYDHPHMMRRDVAAKFLASKSAGRAQLSKFDPSISFDLYRERLKRIHDYIVDGDVYQINFTFPHELALKGDPATLYNQLTAFQPVGHGALILTEDFAALSFSPELFFEITGNTISAHPMKGTAARRPGAAEDLQAAFKLARDPKQRAENLMILDLIRNDIGRVALPGSVNVPDIFRIETFRTVHQMTSRVKAELPQDFDFASLCKALFPCGSITGAPKLRAMEVIRELEETPRGLYTGSIGYLGPHNEACFNVAIRTMEFRKSSADVWQGKVGVGGGIVFDSDIADEWLECQTKLKFLDGAQDMAEGKPFDLIETMRWTADEGFYLIDHHMARLSQSARYFDYPFDEGRIRHSLNTHVAEETNSALRVRLLLSGDGDISISSVALPSPQELPAIVIDDERVTSNDPFLHHKTTRRAFYDKKFEEWSERGFGEVLFLNEQNEITECSRHNIFVEKEGVLLTPPLTCGVLPGTFRQHLLETQNPPVREELLTTEDVLSADRVYIGNSVNGLRLSRLGTYALDQEVERDAS